MNEATPATRARAMLARLLDCGSGAGGDVMRDLPSALWQVSLTAPLQSRGLHLAARAVHRNPDNADVHDERHTTDARGGGRLVEGFCKKGGSTPIRSWRPTESVDTHRAVDTRSSGREPQGSGVCKGSSGPTVANGKLYMMALQATAPHYFDAALPEFETMTASATIR